MTYYLFTGSGKDYELVVSDNLHVGGIEMSLSAPKMTTFIAAVVIVLVGLLSALVSIPALTPYALWIILLGFVVLAAGVMIEGM
jgi:hypothetical protein